MVYSSTMLQKFVLKLSSTLKEKYQVKNSSKSVFYF